MTVTVDQFRRSTGREPSRAEAIALLVRSCHDDPDRFNDVVLGRTYRKSSGAVAPGHYWSKQKEICESVVNYKTTIVVTGNAVGKSYLAAGLILWWLYTRVNSLIIVTAPSQTLLGSVIFKEVRRAHSNSRIPLAGEITDSPKVSPQTIVVDSMGWQCIGIATRGVERLSGQHAPELLVLVDEASGIDPPIWEGLSSLNASKTVCFGNPLRAEGEFREMSLRARREADDASIPEHEKVHEIKVPSTESPDADQERSERGLADRGFFDENRRKYGEGSLWWRTHINAEFPDISVDTLIPISWIDACTFRRRKPGEFSGPVRIGIDLGEGVGKDRSVIVTRDDLGIMDVFWDNLAGPEDVAGHVVRKRFQFGVAEHRICYDVGGVYGKDLARYLEQNGLYGCTPYSGSFSGGPDFFNLRSLAAWRLRMRLDPGTAIPAEPDQKTGRIDPKAKGVKQEQFLIEPLEWYPSLREEMSLLNYELYKHRTKLEPKEDMKARLGRSPDLVDALMATFAYLD